MRPTTFYPVALSLALVFAFQGAGAGLSAPSAQAFWLTQNSVVGMDLSTSRIVASHPVKAGAASKIVSSGPFVFLQGDRAVQVLKAGTLERAHVVKFHAEVHDIAVSDSLLVVASGSEIHIVKISGAGQGSILKSLQLPKAAHALTASGKYVYAIDDEVTPFYSHFIDLHDPMAPRLVTKQWLFSGGIMGARRDLVSQAIADRWYVLESSTTAVHRAYHVSALSPKPPIESLERWVVDLMDEFRVHRETLCWVKSGGDDRVWLFRRRLQPSQAASEKLIPLGPLVEWEELRAGRRMRGIIELVGSRLYVAVAGQFLAFDVHPSRPPVRVLQIRAPSPIISFALKGPSR